MKWVRSFWFAEILVVAGSVIAGFAAALLFGVHASFSQPLATLLAGGGALSAGVLAYLNGERGRDQTAAHHRADMDRERERHSEDSRRARESDLRGRYTAIAAQIAHESAAIRQAGVYALTALADDWHKFGENDERQVCINLLQWYLRVPLPQGETSDLSEREIRQTVVGILAQRRCRPSDDLKSWARTAISLSQVSLCHCVLDESEFEDLTMDFADLTGATLRNANLNGANLRGADLTKTNLRGANLAGANLTFAKLDGADLTGADLRGANLHGADLTKADLDRADLTKADLRGARLYGASLFEAKLNWAKLSLANLTAANLAKANLHGVDLLGADLNLAYLADANLTAAKLFKTNLIGAKLPQATLNGADLKSADLTDADLTGAKHNRSTQWPSGFTPLQQSASSDS